MFCLCFYKFFVQIYLFYPKFVSFVLWGLYIYFFNDFFDPLPIEINISPAHGDAYNNICQGILLFWLDLELELDLGLPSYTSNQFYKREPRNTCNLPI